MAHVFSDGFDWLSSIGQLGRRWDHVGQFGTNMLISQTTPAYGGSYVTFANTGSATPTLIKYFPTNLTTFYVHWRVRRANSNNGSTPTLHMVFRDGTTGQFSISYNDQGILSVRNGAVNTTYGSVTFPLTGNMWEHFQARVVVDSVNGQVEIRRNNNPTPVLNLSGINTRSGTSNAFINGVHLFQPQNASVIFHLDDFWVNDTTGAAPTGWPGEIRCRLLSPNGAGNITQFAVASPTLNAGFASGIATAAQTANTIRWSPVTFNVGGVVASADLSILTALTGTMNVALYAFDQTTGLPGAKLAEASPIVNPTTGAYSFTFTPTPTVAPGLIYSAFHASNSVTLHALTGGNSFTSAQSFANGFPANASHLAPQTSGANTPIIVMNYTPENWHTQAELSLADDDTSILSGASGNTDLYVMADLAVTPAVVYGVTPFTLMRKNDSGGRLAGVRVRSGSTEVTTGTVALADGYYFVGNYLSTDPNTTGSWTGSAINALQVGPTVIS